MIQDVIFLDLGLRNHVFVKVGPKWWAMTQNGTIDGSFCGHSHD